MKALTLHQPWASLVALGVKKIETRSWSTKYRGPLAIHAAARELTRADCRVGDYRVRGVGSYVGGVWVMEGPGLPAYRSTPRFEGCVLPLGAVVATCTLVDVVPTKSLWWCDAIQWSDSDEDAEHLQLAGWGRDGENYFAVGEQRPYGDFAPGRFAWLLADIKPLDPPVPSPPGEWHRGLWTWDPVSA